MTFFCLPNRRALHLPRRPARDRAPRLPLVDTFEAIKFIARPEQISL
jgi:hypothetical protein